MSAYSARRLDAAFAALDGHFRALVAPPAPPPDRAHDDGGNGGGNNGGGNGKGAAPPAVPLATLIPKLIKLPAWALPDPAGQPPAATPNGSAQQATAPNGGGPTGGGPGGGGATLGEVSRSRSRRSCSCLPVALDRTAVFRCLRCLRTPRLHAVLLHCTMLYSRPQVGAFRGGPRSHARTVENGQADRDRD